MTRWIVIAALILGAHFVTTFNVPARTGRAWLGWPFAVGEAGVLGRVRGPSATGSTIAVALAASTAIGFVCAILALLSIWLPHGWWPALATVSSIGSLVLMSLFFKPNKLAAIAVDLVVLGAAIATALAAVAL
jgi:hypothetical protein